MRATYIRVEQQNGGLGTYKVNRPVKRHVDNEWRSPEMIMIWSIHPSKIKQMASPRSDNYKTRASDSSGGKEWKPQKAPRRPSERCPQSGI